MYLENATTVSSCSKCIPRSLGILTSVVFLSYSWKDFYNAGLIYCYETIICINNDNGFREKKKKPSNFSLA